MEKSSSGPRVGWRGTTNVPTSRPNGSPQTVLRTGDLGERRPDGLLRITGHKEDLFNTGKGKYVAPAPIESRLNAHSMIEVALVSGAGQHAPYGVFVLEEQLRGRLSHAGVRAKVNAELAELLH